MSAQQTEDSLRSDIFREHLICQIRELYGLVL